MAPANEGQGAPGTSQASLGILQGICKAADDGLAANCLFRWVFQALKSRMVKGRARAAIWLKLLQLGRQHLAASNRCPAHPYLYLTRTS